MPLKFRLKGLAETFVDKICCPSCGHDGGSEGDQGFTTELTRVTYDGIVVVIQCSICNDVFVPDGQRQGVINSQRQRLGRRRRQRFRIRLPVLCYAPPSYSRFAFFPAAWLVLLVHIVLQCLSLATA